jgi:cell division protein FtsQ
VTTGAARFRSPAVLAIAGVIALGIGAWVVLNSAFFAIREVRVLGAQEMPAEEIRRLAAVRTGENLITLETGAVVSRLEEHPRIDHAVVERDLPSTVVIRVIERRPSGWLRDPNGVVVLGGDGIVLNRSNNPVPGLPDIGVWPDVLAPGQRVDGLRDALHVTSFMPSGVLRQIESVASEGSDLVLRLRAGGSVLYGSSALVRAKNRALEGLLRWATEEGIAVRTIDVRVPSAPSLEPVRGESVPDPLPSP